MNSRRSFIKQLAYGSVATTLATPALTKLLTGRPTAVQGKTFTNQHIHAQGVYRNCTFKQCTIIPIGDLEIYDSTFELADGQNFIDDKPTCPLPAIQDHPEPKVAICRCTIKAIEREGLFPFSSKLGITPEGEWHEQLRHNPNRPLATPRTHTGRRRSRPA